VDLLADSWRAGRAGIKSPATVFNRIDRSKGLERPATENTRKKMVTMKKFGFATLIAGGMSAVVLGLASPAQADIVTNPTTPNYSVDNHDNANTTNGFVDLPF
jgi:hypothetical protein